tara:strand:+ start:41 stop:292 length:252 start_codon:yes stop_codon:yes gene_type:complete
MDKKVKFSDEEVNELKEIRDSYETVAHELGQIQLQQVFLKDRDVEIKESLKVLKDRETKQADKLQKKYGVGTLDIDTGEFIPS